MRPEAGRWKASARISFRPTPIFRWSRRPIPLPTSTACSPSATCCPRRASWPARRPARCLSAALRYCREQTTPNVSLTFVCDSGNKYLSKVFDDFWLAEQGLSEREQHGDLCDLVAALASRRRHGLRRSRGHASHRLWPHAPRRRFAASGPGRRQACRHHRRKRHPRESRRALYDRWDRFNAPVRTCDDVRIRTRFRPARRSTRCCRSSTATRSPSSLTATNSSG